MNVYVPSSLPRNTLPPMALQHKFREARARMAGLGEYVCTVDESGDYCYDDGTGAGDVSGGMCPGTPGCPGYVAPSDWTTYGVPVSSSGSTSWDPYISSSGDLILRNSSGGGYTTISPSGARQVGYGAAPAPSSGQVTNSQSLAYAQLIASLATAGVRIAAATNLPPGATILPNGTIVGSGQSFTSGGVNAALTNIFANPLLILAAAAVMALAVSK